MKLSDKLNNLLKSRGLDVAEKEQYEVTEVSDNLNISDIVANLIKVVEHNNGSTRPTEINSQSQG